MKTLVSIAAALIVAMAVAGLAVAGSFEKSWSLKSGATSFTLKIPHPKKIILYPEASHVQTSYSIVCTKGAKVSSLSRSFTTPFTRNLLWHIPAKQDACSLAVAAATSSDAGQIVVDVRN